MAELKNLVHINCRSNTQDILKLIINECLESSFSVQLCIYQGKCERRKMEKISERKEMQNKAVILTAKYSLKSELLHPN